MKNIYLTIDLEEWYDLDYLKDYDLEHTGVEVMPQIFDFLDLLDFHKVKATFFIIANIVEKNADIVREIIRRGHIVGCHGLDHRLLYDKTDEQFYREICMAKEKIESVTQKPVDGFRASCFSLERDKLEFLKKAGFSFDSSKIKFEHHPLYRNLNLDGFISKDDLIYIDGDFTEYEIPTLNIWKYSIPISGGGYLRLFPTFLMKFFLKRYEKDHHNFLLYLHPFELTDCALPLPSNLSAATKFRCLVGRKGNLKKMNKIIGFLKKRGATFNTLSTVSM